MKKAIATALAAISVFGITLIPSIKPLPTPPIPPAEGEEVPPLPEPEIEPQGDFGPIDVNT